MSSSSSESDPATDQVSPVADAMSPVTDLTHAAADNSVFKDPQLAKELIRVIAQQAPSRPLTFMEVCGTHTVSIARAGIRDLMPETVHLASGPGCPVCVTSNRDIDTVIALARIPSVEIATFGDMTRVPGSSSSLLAEQAAGKTVHIVYSPLDALQLAQTHPEKQIVFVGVGFETTTPLIAMAIKRAAAANVRNFSVFVAHKNMPGALETIVADPNLNVDGLILPGHVSTIIGKSPYQFLADTYGVPGVITGFEPVDILQGIAMLIRQINENKPRIEIAYLRGVREQGNTVARAVMDEVFETCSATWRGLGVIPESGFKLRDAYAAYDAVARFDPEPGPTVEPQGCRCGEVLRAHLTPDQCPLFRRVCTPENPVGPCMVSSEGSCAAYYRYY